MLNLTIPSDTPLFRAHLYTLSHTTSLLAKTCKAALSSAGQVRDCLEALRKAEQKFMEDLEKLDKVLTTGESSVRAEKAVSSDLPMGETLDDIPALDSPSTITPEVTESQSPIRSLAVQLEAQRALEMDKMEKMVLSRLRATRDGLKVRGVVGGSGTTGSGEALALGSFEDTSKAYYTSLGRYLAPGSHHHHHHHHLHHRHTASSDPSSSSSNPNAMANTTRSTSNERTLADKEFELERYDIESLFLWSCPPTSVECLDLQASLDGWLVGLLDSGATGLGSLVDGGSDGGGGGEEDPQVERDLRGRGGFKGDRVRTVSEPAMIVKGKMAPITRSAASGSGANGRLVDIRDEDQDGDYSVGDDYVHLISAPNKKTAMSRTIVNRSDVRRRLDTRLTKLAARREALEYAWGERERLRVDLEKRVEQERVTLAGGCASSEGLAGLGSKSTPAPGKKDRRKSGIAATMTGTSGSTSTVDSATGAIEGKKKHRGMGSRMIRGMMSSASSIHGGLSSMVGSGKDDRVKPAAASSSASAGRMSLQIPPRPIIGHTDNVDAEDSEYRRPKMSNRLSLQTVPSRHQDPASSGPAEYKDDPGARLDGGLLSPTISIMTTATDFLATDTPSTTPALAESKKFPTFRDLQDQTAAEMIEEETLRVQAGRRKEGLVWSPGVWEGVGSSSGRSGGERKEKVKWESCWMVLSSCKIYEYRGGITSKLGTANQVIDLRFATAREGRDTDRNFAFEIVTPTQGKRLYQATSREETKSWIYAISNAVESVLNGTSSFRDMNHLVDRDLVDDYGSPFDPTGTPIGLGFPSFSVEDTEGERVGISSSWHKAVGKKPSLKEALRQSRTSLGFGNSKSRSDLGALQKENSKSGDPVKKNRSSLSIPSQEVRPGLLGSRSRQSSRSSEGSNRALSVFDLGLEKPQSRYGFASRGIDTIPIEAQERRNSGYSMEFDDGMRQAILVANSSEAEDGFVSPPNEIVTVDNAVRSRSAASQSHENIPLSRPVSRPFMPSEEQTGITADMAMLRKVADQPSNQTCADCKRSLKGEYTQRWATVSLHNRPIVMFLCQRCAGIHRGLGSHVSKIRSPDLDKWTEEMILTARSSGNMRGNAVWERNRCEGGNLQDLSLPNLKEHIENKYIQGIWLSADDRAVYFDDRRGIAI